MSSKAILLVDMDEVVCDWYGHVLRRYRIANPDLPFVPEEELRQFEVHKSYPDLCRPALFRAMEAKGLFENLDPVPGALEALRDIETNHKDRIEPFLCSSPYLHSEDLLSHSEKARWVEKHLGHWWLERLILTRDKTMVRGHVLIDDKPDITGAMTPTWQQLVYDRSWNRHVDLPRFTWADWPQLRDSLLALTTPN